MHTGVPAALPGSAEHAPTPPTETPAAADLPVAGAASTETPPPPPPAPVVAHGPLARHWNTLGIPPTDNLDRLETAFYLMVERFSSNPTEEEERRRLELHRAYAVLRRSLQARGGVVVERRFEMPGLTRRQWVTAGLAAAISLAGLVYFNFGAIKLSWVQYEPGTVVRLAGASESFGTIVRFDPAHRFEIGKPGPAYLLTRAGTEESLWLSERVVEKGMLREK